MFYDLNQLRTLKLKGGKEGKRSLPMSFQQFHLWKAFVSFSSSCSLESIENSRILMLFELMNMEAANLVYQNTTIKPSRMLRTSEEIKSISIVTSCSHSPCSFFFPFFPHEIPFLFEKRNKYRPRHQHINQYTPKKNK